MNQTPKDEKLRLSNPFPHRTYLVEIKTIYVNLKTVEHVKVLKKLSLEGEDAFRATKEEEIRYLMENNVVKSIPYNKAP